MLSFIIPTYNEEKNLSALLVELKKQMQKEDEIIVVDSYSKDNTVKIATTADAKVIMQPKLGIGLAKTEGARNAKNEFLVMLDADSIPAPDFAVRIKKQFAKRPNLVALAGLDLYSSSDRRSGHNCTGNGISSTSSSQFWKLLYNIYSIKVFYLARIIHLITGKYWLPANNCVIRKEVFLSVGGYRSVVCEDNDLMKRLPATREVIYDRNVIVTLSDRRFRESGFFRTVLLWILADLRIWFGKGKDAKDYRK
jgi:glycosyltransferase involved in cell wall biosynthesis